MLFDLPWRDSGVLRFVPCRFRCIDPCLSAAVPEWGCGEHQDQISTYVFTPVRHIASTRLRLSPLAGRRTVPPRLRFRGIPQAILRHEPDRSRDHERATCRSRARIRLLLSLRRPGSSVGASAARRRSRAPRFVMTSGVCQVERQSETSAPAQSTDQDARRPKTRTACGDRAHCPGISRNAGNLPRRRARLPPRRSVSERSGIQSQERMEPGKKSCNIGPVSDDLSVTETKPLDRLRVKKSRGTRPRTSNDPDNNVRKHVSLSENGQ